ncbi:MAG: hypothetical protein WB245_09845 [Acidimicrobiia bacterium]
MQTKNVLYAAVGAPVVAARKVGVKVKDLRSKIADETSGYSKAAEKAINDWAVEGEKVVGKISDGKVVDEITSKVDLDQAKVQVTKLRDQLEDMLATWRSSFRPESAESQPVVEKAAPKPAAKKPAAKKPATKTSAAKATGSAAAKKSPAKSAPVKTEKAS